MAMEGETAGARPDGADERGEFAEDLLARFVDLAREGGFDRQLFEALHPGAAAHLEEVLRRGAARPLHAGSSADAPEPGAGAPEAGALGAQVRAAFQRLTAEPPTRYRTEGEVARGGQGSILRVWDEFLRRHLAMKVTHAGEPAEGSSDATHVTRSMGRFVEEARVTAQLDHPGIVPVHEFGKDGAGRLFFTMKLVKGRDLKEVFGAVARGAEGWTRTRALSVLLRVCEGMAYAHSKGVIHRDLKPANVMVGRFGEVYVMDWGLARVLEQPDTRDVRVRPPSLATTRVHSVRDETAGGDGDAPLITMDGDVVGTPAYMSPEQAVGAVEAMGPHSDVYSAGAMLYHLLAGHPPYVPPGSRPSNHAVWYRVQEGPPTPLHERAPGTPAELLAICDRAMARDPAQRYRDMSELAEDLRAYLENRVVRAYETGAVAELRKWVHRNRPLALSLGAALVAVVGGLAAVSAVERSGRERAEQLRQQAEASEARAQAQTENVLRLSAFQKLAELRERAATLWPAVPAHVADLGNWLDEADGLVARLPALKASLAELRRRATRPSPAEVDPAIAAELEHVRARRDALRRALHPDARNEARPVEASAVTGTRYELNEQAWKLVDPAREVFGREAEGLWIIEQAFQAPDTPGQTEAERAEMPHRMNDTLAWAYFASGLEEEALALSEATWREAPPGLRPEAGSWYWKLRRLVDERRLGGEWDLARLDRRVAALEWRASGARLEREEDRWWYAQLETLIEQLEDLRDPRGLAGTGTVPGQGWAVRRRLELAASLEERSRTGAEASRLWETARAEIAASPAYGGLDLAPQLGLVPLGADPESGLQEFCVVQSGAVSRRGDDGALALGPESAIVLVLVPGGRFLMGAQKDRPGAPGYDPLAEPHEQPPHEVELDPYFLSKYELTQAQWKELDGTEPSLYHSGGQGGELWPTHPVEGLSWEACQRVLPRAGLRLPTEAEWERAARAGTTGPWAGLEEGDLPFTVNLYDQPDGAPQHRAVDEGVANRFGFLAMLGNVSEWCRDAYDPGAYQGLPARNPLANAPGLDRRVLRGGSFGLTALRARVSYRAGWEPQQANTTWGVRPARSVDP